MDLIIDGLLWFSLLYKSLVCNHVIVDADAAAIKRWAHFDSVNNYDFLTIEYTLVAATGYQLN